MDKIISLVIGAGWVIAVYTVGPLYGEVAGGKDGLAIVGLLVIALGLIWFGEELGDYVGPAGRGHVTQRTPGCFVKVFGWAALLGLVGFWIYKVAT